MAPRSSLRAIPSWARASVSKALEKRHKRLRDAYAAGTATRAELEEHRRELEAAPETVHLVRYLVEAKEWLRGERSDNPNLEINRRKGRKIEFTYFGVSDVPAGFRASFYPDGQLHTAVGPQGSLVLAHGKPAGRLETTAWCEEFHSNGLVESWGGLFQHDPAPCDKTFAQWVRGALNQL